MAEQVESNQGVEAGFNFRSLRRYAFPSPTLSTWLRKLDEEVKENLIKDRHLFGEVQLLSKVPIHWEIIEALVACWVPGLSLFRFGENEITVTLEDVRHILNLKDDDLPPHNPMKPSYKSDVLAYLGLNRNCLAKGGAYGEKMVTRLEPTFFSSEAFKRREQSPQVKYNTIILLICNELYFPRRDKCINPALTAILPQIRFKANLAHLVLAQIYQGLSEASNGKADSVYCCLPLLTIWLANHLEKFTVLKARPLTRPRQVEFYIKNLEWPTQSKQDWYTYLQSIREEDIHWLGTPFPSRHMEASFESATFLVLVGLTTVEPYYPIRVVRQFGFIQGIPVHQDCKHLTGTLTEAISTRVMTKWKSVVIMKEDQFQRHTFGLYKEWVKKQVRGENKPTDPVILRPPSHVAYRNFIEEVQLDHRRILLKTKEIVAEKEARIQQLEAENEVLRTENDQLRRQLTRKRVLPSDM